VVGVAVPAEPVFLPVAAC